ncbi:hypothetical protein L0P88_13745 [Muricauda sp. SCSIO 64092]|uniref:hypothetical protein n=1 Tax=Allomuricauda sp. SCSIO 64092 TaxID=2908842 RepID=UPI001FF22257|nr:hypothetical protein [Muricauda sp. SCSIO 64092]UOY05015.1 hypothetical protein L0P88_13745 [Muricauda sp. SCSIO 64092]
MKEIIKRENVAMFIVGHYGITTNELFAAREKNQEFFEPVMEDVFETFVSAVKGEQNNLKTLNPHTQEMEVFCQRDIGAIDSFDNLMENLSKTYADRKAHLSQSFYQELGIDKKEVEKRIQEMKATRSRKSKDREELEP